MDKSFGLGLALLTIMGACSMIPLLAAVEAAPLPVLAQDTPIQASEVAGNFQPQIERLHASISNQCRGPMHILPPDDFSGALYSCTSGTASLIAIAAPPPAIENLQTLRVSWNDVFNRASGARLVHADRAAALFFVTAAATYFAPDLVDEILIAFEGDTPRQWQIGNVALSYSYFRATLSDERVLTIGPAGLN